MQWVQGRAWESAFLTCSPVMLMLLAQPSRFEYQSPAHRPPAGPVEAAQASSTGSNSQEPHAASTPSPVLWTRIKPVLSL